jgi:hypothetical protein
MTQHAENAGAVVLRLISEAVQETNPSLDEDAYIALCEEWLAGWEQDVCYNAGPSGVTLPAWEWISLTATWLTNRGAPSTAKAALAIAGSMKLKYTDGPRAIEAQVVHDNDEVITRLLDWLDSFNVAQCLARVDSMLTTGDQIDRVVIDIVGVGLNRLADLKKERIRMEQEEEQP